MSTMSDIPTAELISPALSDKQDELTNETKTFMQLELTGWIQSGQANDNEYAIIDDLANSVKCVLNAEGSTVSCSLDYNDSPAIKTAETGTGALYAGGDNGTVTELDGSTRDTNVPENFWGTRVSWLERSGRPITENIEIRLHTLVPAAVTEAVESSSDSIGFWLCDNVITPTLRKELSSS